MSKNKKMAKNETVSKFIRDPIHNLIRIEDPLVLDILDTAPVQRLQLIHQLPMTSYVYPGATHTRLSHSLGVYHLACRLLRQLRIIDKRDQLVVKLAALLHDVGHGPFSHLFETVLREAGYFPKSKEPIKHEWWTNQIVLNHQSICKALDNYDNQLKNDITSVISNTYMGKKHLCGIVSSQFDADRFDYMLRDSLMTGVQYGKFDLEWIFRNLSLEMVPDFDEDRKKQVRKRKRIILDGKRGLSCLEEYLLGNLYLYKHVYFHRTVQAAEGMMIKIIRRAIDLIKKDKDIKIKNRALSKIARDQLMEVNDYLELNDSLVFSWLQTWATSKTDAILKTMSTQLLERKLYKAFPISVVKGPQHTRLMKIIEDKLKEKGFNPDYNLIESESRRIAYKDLFFFQRKGEAASEIYIKGHDNKIMPYTAIRREDNPVSEAIFNIKIDEQLIIIPPDFKNDMEKILKEEA